MPRRRQMDLLEWQPPEPVSAFEPRLVQAAHFAGSLSRAISASLATHDESRAAVAASMSAWLGKTISKPMLDAYASQGREDHVIATDRFAALVNVTRDRRLLELLAEPLGWTVIDRRYLPMIELAALREHEDELRSRADALRRAVRRGGLL